MPVLQVACVCENVIIDQVGVASLIRIIDQVEVNIPDNLPANMPSAFPIKAFLRFQSGKFRGTGTVGLSVIKPDGTTGGTLNSTISIAGDDDHQGAQIISELQIISPQEGIYSVNFAWNGEPFASTTMRVKIKKLPIVAPGNPAESPTS